MENHHTTDNNCIPIMQKCLHTYTHTHSHPHPHVHGDYLEDAAIDNASVPAACVTMKIRVDFRWTSAAPNHHLSPL